MTVLLFLLTAVLVPTRAFAQLCRGFPSHSVFAVGTRDQDGTMTGELGIGPMGMVGLTGNVAKPNEPANGSASISYGGRIYWGRTVDKWGACVLSGVQVGYSHLINAEGLRVNARITSTTVPVGFGYGRTLRLTRGIQLIAYTIPQVLLHSRSLVLYSRADTLATIPSTSTDYGVDLGGGLLFGPLLFRGSAFRSKDLPWSWRVSAGVSR